MDLMGRFARALLVLGTVIFVWDQSWAGVAVSTASLSASATGSALLVAEPFICPLAPKGIDIVSPFGKRDVLSAPKTGGTTASETKSEMHEGVDYSASPGALVRASRGGRVIFAGFSKMYVSRADKTDQSRLVIIRHPDGMSTRYVHLSALRVRPGQDVKSGQWIGVLADSDEWVVPVLHFEIRDVQGHPVDPEQVITEVEKP
jgi:murein DD-endopeptidase MepM/ murein hydrolase activator NlpD